MKNVSPILIVGMARSGTTLTSHILGSLPNTYTEIEPHALWKSGNFRYINDEEFDLDETITASIRNRFLKDLPQGKTLIEKSPINCLRPELVHKVFPEAKIVYVERDPVRCIYSNYERSINNDSFKLSIILKKYFSKSGSKDLDGAIGKRKLFQQIHVSDLPYFFGYTYRMFYIRNINNQLPFGPKLKDFKKIVSQNGLLHYHTEVYKKALIKKKVYIDLYKDNFRSFSMEKLMNDMDEVQRLVDFTGIDYSEEWLKNISGTFNPDRIKKASKSRKEDQEILKLLS